MVPDGAERASALRRSLAIFQAEEGFDQIDPGGPGRREVEMEAGMAFEPGLDLWCACGVAQLSATKWRASDFGASRALDGSQETQELLM